jgi:hypothetical protein
MPILLVILTCGTFSRPPSPHRDLLCGAQSNIMEQRCPPRDEISRSRGRERGTIWRHRAGTTQISLPVAHVGELMEKCTTGRYD